MTALQGKETKAKAQLVAFDSVNAKFLAVKTNALSLSLESNFLTKKSLERMIASRQPRSPWASLTRRMTSRWYG